MPSARESDVAMTTDRTTITWDPSVLSLSSIPVFENGRILFKNLTIRYDMDMNEISRSETTSGVSLGFPERPMTETEAMEIIDRSLL